MKKTEQPEQPGRAGAKPRRAPARKGPRGGGPNRAGRGREKRPRQPGRATPKTADHGAGQGGRKGARRTEGTRHSPRSQPAPAPAKQAHRTTSTTHSQPRRRKKKPPVAAERKPRPPEPAGAVPRQVPLGWQEPIIPLVCAVLVQKWEACGLKKYGVAVHARISRTTPGAIEQQATEPGLEIIGRICYVCGTTLAEVLLEAARRLPTALLLLPWLRLLLPEALLPTASSIMD